MNRRGFIRLAGFLPLVALPGLASGHDDIDPRTIPELIEWFEHNFDCRQGLRRAYAVPWDGVNYDGEIQKYVYKTYGLYAEDTTLNRERLVLSMWTTFREKLKADPSLRGATLYWRHPWKVDLEQFREFDDDKTYVLIRSRIALPEHDFRPHPLYHREGERYGLA